MKERTDIKPYISRGSRLWNLVGLIFILSLSMGVGLSGCGDTTGAGKASDPESFTFGGTLYVVNEGDGSLVAFDSQDPVSNKPAIKATIIPRLQEGNITPSRRFPEAVTGPTGIFLDRANDVLYVANTGQNAIAIYENASTLTTPVSATRVIAGDKTLLDKPYGVTFDATNNRLFVANRDSNSVVVFDQNCGGATVTLSGNIAPCRLLLIDGVAPPIFPRSVAIDTIKDLLYISTAGNDSISIYTNTGLLGGKPSECLTDFTPCRFAPTRVISPHTGTEDESKLELPFGIFIDSDNDRLYVANAGLNKPAVLIYESASTLDGGVVPGRVIAGLNAQLTVPSGIDVDVATGQVYVVNNNSPNNVNLSSGNNVDSPSLIIFDNIDTSCTTAMHLCNISPDERIGGDATPDADPTMASPIGVAIDLTRNITYVANTGANNILLFSLEGDREPTKINAGGSTAASPVAFPKDITSFEDPSSLFYDADIDRLYVSNFGNFGFGSNSAAAIPVLVYDKFSTININNTEPSWTIAAVSNFDNMRGFHIDKQRGYFIVLSNDTSNPKLTIYCVPNSDGLFNVNCTPSNTEWTEFPTNNATGSSGASLTPPTAFKEFTTDLTTGLLNGPRAMAVDETRGLVYVADRGADAVFVYNLGNENTPTPPFRDGAITGNTNTKLNEPHGLAVDATRDILYVSNIGDNTLLSFENVSTKDGDTAPDRTVTTLTLAEEDKLKTPISLSIDTKENELFLMNAFLGQESIFIYRNANTLNGEKSPDRTLTGSNTLLDFTPPQAPAREIGSLLVSNQNEVQTLFVVQPESPSCDKTILADCPTGALLVFSVQGKVAPGRIWAGGVGSFATPTGMGVDTTLDILYVVNQATNTLSRLKDATKVDVTLTPSTGKTDLSNIQLHSPRGLFVDSAQNRLYISNASSISVFNRPDQLSDGATPDQTTTVQLNDPRGLTVDSGRNLLYVANAGNHSVSVYTVNTGIPIFKSIITGLGTQLDVPIDVAIDSTRDLLYVLNSGATEILVFEGASSISGDVVPNRVISGGDKDTNNFTGATDGNNFMVNPSAIFVDPVNDLLYVADRDSDTVYFFLNASIAEDKIENGITVTRAEHKFLSGDNTGLNKPSALFVDTTGSP